GAGPGGGRAGGGGGPRLGAPPAWSRRRAPLRAPRPAGDRQGGSGRKAPGGGRGRGRPPGAGLPRVRAGDEAADRQRLVTSDTRGALPGDGGPAARIRVTKLPSASADPPLPPLNTYTRHT